MAFQALVSVYSTGSGRRYDFPEPSTYSAITSTLVDSGRNTEGRFIGTVIRDDISKVEISWKYLTVEQWRQIQICFSERSGGNFVNLVTFFDQTLGAPVTKAMYVNDRKAGMWRRDPKTGEILGWTDCSLSLIEA